MAVRIRTDGSVLCAAMHAEKQGDTYLDDALHYELSVVKKVLVTDRHHINGHGQWWWRGNVPAEVIVDPFYSL